MTQTSTLLWRLPVESWPVQDQLLWQSACEPRPAWSIFKNASAWSDRRRKIVEEAYGKFLGYLKQVDQLDFDLGPAQRLVPRHIAGFIDWMDARGDAPHTVAMHVGAVRSFGGVVEPDTNWKWLGHIAWLLKSHATPIRDKRAVIVAANDLFQLGFQMMDSVSQSDQTAYFKAARFRDGLMVALLIARPLRIRNFQDIEIGRSLIMRNGQYWLCFTKEETKTSAPIEVPFPQPLVPYLEEYLMVHRQTLLAFRKDLTVPPTRYLWVSRLGEAATEHAIRDQIKLATKHAFGREIPPHYFRDAAATSIALDCPDEVMIIADILGHATLATAEKHYIQATSIVALNAYQNLIKSLRTAQDA